MKSATVEYAVEVDRLELHGLVERAMLRFLQKLLDIQVDLLPVLILIIGDIRGIALPPPLLLLTEVLVILGVSILALDANTKLAALLAAFVAEAVLLLAVGLLAGAEDEVLHEGLVGVDLLHVVHVLAFSTLDQLQQLRLLLPRPPQALPLALQLEPAGLLQILVLAGDAGRTTLPNHADLPRGQEATAVHTLTLLVSASTLMLDFILRFSGEVLLLNFWSNFISLMVQEYASRDLWERR